MRSPAVFVHYRKLLWLGVVQYASVLSAPAEGVFAGHFQQLSIYLLAVIRETLNERLDEPFSAALIFSQLHCVIYSTNNSMLILV